MLCSLSLLHSSINVVLYSSVNLQHHYFGGLNVSKDPVTSLLTVITSYNEHSLASKPTSLLTHVGELSLNVELHNNHQTFIYNPHPYQKQLTNSSPSASHNRNHDNIYPLHHPPRRRLRQPSCIHPPPNRSRLSNRIRRLPQRHPEDLPGPQATSLPPTSARYIHNLPSTIPPKLLHTDR